MQVEIWSDVVCPWCYIGKRRFEHALAAFEHRDEVEVVWRSFELDPNAPTEASAPVRDTLAQKYGVSTGEAAAMLSRVTSVAAEEGLTYRFDRAMRANTFAAHRIIHMAAEHGKADAMKERLLAGYFHDGEAIADAEVLVRLAVEVGLDEHDARRALADPAVADAVRADEALATEMGITAVPFFAFDRRYGVAGAQSSEGILDVLERAWRERATAAT